MTDWAQCRRTALLALLVAAAVYAPRLGAPLIWDDRSVILFNTALDHPIPLRRYLAPGYFSFSGEQTWRPLATLSYAVVVAAFGKSALAMRLAMWTVHLANAGLLAVLLDSVGFGAAAAAAAASLFLIHPVQSETLMVVSFNEELLSSFGLLLLLVLHRRRRPGLAWLGLAAALLSKETGVAGLALAPLLDFAVGGAQEARRRIRDYALYGAVTALYLCVRFGPLKGPGGEANLSAVLPFSERLFYASEGFASAARILLLPVRLRIEYFALPASSGLIYAGTVACAAAIMAGLLWLARRFYSRKEPLLAFFLLWPLPFLAVTSNILPTGVLSLRYMAERWLYLPSLGVMAVLGYFLCRRPRWLAALLILWGALGFMSVRDWGDETRLWSSLIAVYPWSAKAHEGLGEAYFREGNFTQALAEFEKGRELRDKREDLVLAHYASIAPPGTIGWESASLYRWLGLCEMKLDHPREAETMLSRAAALDPSDWFTLRALAYLAAGQGDFPKAAAWLKKGLTLNPADEFLRRLAPDIAARRLTFRADFH